MFPHFIMFRSTKVLKVIKIFGNPLESFLIKFEVGVLS